jgi:hypothetical protein
MEFFDRPFVVPSIFLAVALLAGLALVGWGISGRGNQNTISVTGSASENATADEATWAIDLQQIAYSNDVAGVSTEVANDANAISKYLNAQNLASSSVTIAAVTASENYSQNGTAQSYTITDTVTVSTSDVNKINTLSQNIGALDNVVYDGSVVSPEQPQYFISDLAAMRISLLGEAIKDAKARATQIAQSGGSSVGALEDASSGVVQVATPDSANSEDDGEYDTSTIQKEVTETVRADFYVR